MIEFNGKRIGFTRFGNKELKLDLNFDFLEIRHFNTVHFTYEGDESLIELLIFKSHLDVYLSNNNTELFINYMPYSRMDRVEGDVAFSLKYISNLINSMNFQKIYVLEPHSDVCLATLNNAEAVYATTNIIYKMACEGQFDRFKDYLFFPDAGAMKRYGKFFPSYRTLVGFKTREFNSGNIENLQILGQIEKGRKVVIVDDLCSGGRTFKMAAEKLKEQDCGEIQLVVAHCEDTIFKYDFLDDENITQIHTTDSMIRTQEHDKIIVHSLKHL